MTRTSIIILALLASGPLWAGGSPIYDSSVNSVDTIIAPLKPNAVFLYAKGSMITIGEDGNVTIPVGVTLDAASRAFYAAVGVQMIGCLAPAEKPCLAPADKPTETK